MDGIDRGRVECPLAPCSRPTVARHIETRRLARVRGAVAILAISLLFLFTVPAAVGSESDVMVLDVGKYLGDRNSRLTKCIANEALNIGLPLAVAGSHRGPIPGLGPCSDYSVYYGPLDDQETLDDLKKFDLVVLHPDYVTRTHVEELQAAGVVVLGYVSIGEEPLGSPTVGNGLGPVYYAPGDNCGGVPDRHCQNAGVASFYLDEDQDHSPDEHGRWSSYYVDPTSPVWRDRVRTCHKSGGQSCSFYGTDYVINTLVCDGLFLDTLDTASPWHDYWYTLDGMVELIQYISSLYPDECIVINRGVFFADPIYKADEVIPYINGMVWEAYFSEWDWDSNQGIISPWFEDNRDNWAHKWLTQCEPDDTGCTLFALDYFQPDQNTLFAEQIEETVVRWGWLNYISTPFLDTVRWEAWDYSRSCCVFLPLVRRHQVFVRG